MTGTVRAKFKVTKISNTDTRYEGGSAQRLYHIELRPVSDGSEENKQFYAWTPGGEIQLSTVNEAVAEAFKDFGDFYVDFQKAPDAKAKPA